MHVNPISSSPGVRARTVSIIGALTVAGAVILAPSAAHAATMAVDDQYTVGAGAAFTTPAASGVLANDVDVDPMTPIKAEDVPAHGMLTALGADGSFTYEPEDGFVGDDTFTYCFTLAPTLPCLGAPATVTLHVVPTIERISGADRYAVSAGISASRFEPEVGTAYVASGEVFADALSASAAAGAEGAPVLLVTKDTIPAVIATELARLEPQKIVVLGGTNTISAEVEIDLATNYSDVVTRIGGADRYAVSAGVSADTFGPMRPVAYIASGEVFPDALSGSAAAGAEGGPVLLVSKNSIPAVVQSELDRLDPAKIVVLGGTNTVSDTVLTALQATAATTRIAGADRYAVSANVSADAFMPADTHTVYVASGEVFPDALSGSAGAIKNGAPVLLVTKNTVPGAVATELDRLQPNRIVVLGGTNTISAATYAELEEHLAH